VDLIDGLRDPLEAVELIGRWWRVEIVRLGWLARLAARRTEMGTRMRNRHANPESFAALELRALAENRLREVLRVRRREIHEVTVVAHDTARVFEDRASARGGEVDDFCVGERLRRPLPLVPRENLDRTEAKRDRFIDRGAQRACGRQVRADPVLLAGRGACGHAHPPTAPSGAGSTAPG